MSDLNDAQKAEFESLVGKNYKEQAVSFLNAFWNEVGTKAEEIFKHWQTMIELDKQQHNALPPAKKPETYSQGKDLDEFWSHKFLETIGKTMTAVEFRQEFKKIDSNVDKKMGMIEFLLWEYKQSPKELVTRPQGTADPEALKAITEAQKLLDDVSVAFAAAEKRKAEATAAETELKTEMAKLKEQEDNYSKKTQELQTKSEGGGVAAMKAKNELAQHLGEDPLPLRKAKLSTEAATKKAEKARKAAEDAFALCAKKLQEAEDYLAQQRLKGGGPTLGLFWWMDRDLQEKKKFMPSSGKAVKNVNI